MQNSTMSPYIAHQLSSQTISNWNYKQFLFAGSSVNGWLLVKSDKSSIFAGMVMNLILWPLVLSVDSWKSLLKW